MLRPWSLSSRNQSVLISSATSSVIERRSKIQEMVTSRAGRGMSSSHMSNEVLLFPGNRAHRLEPLRGSNGNEWTNGSANWWIICAEDLNQMECDNFHLKLQRRPQDK